MEADLQVALGVHAGKGVVLYNDSTGRGGESLVAGRILYLVLMWMYKHHTGFKVMNATDKVRKPSCSSGTSTLAQLVSR